MVVKDSWLQSLLMMSAHFVFFGIQAILLFIPLRSPFWSVSTTSLYGALIEYHQLAVPGRSGDPLDWLLDTMGALTFLFLHRKLQSRQI